MYAKKERSHWSRSIEILCSYWLYTRGISCLSLVLYGIRGGFHAMKGSIRGTGMSNKMLYDALLSTLSYEGNTTQAECYERQCLGMRKSDREVFSPGRQC